MNTATRNKISLITAILGALSAVFLEAAHTPGEGWTRYSVIFGIFALAAMRLYLFYEGVALAEISKVKAKWSFYLSVILSVALAGYGIAIWWVNPEFELYALALFLMLQMGLAFTEWVFSTRTGEKVNTLLATIQGRNQKLLEIAKGFRKLSKDQASQILANTERINTLSKENSKQAARLLKLEQEKDNATKILASLTKGKPKILRVNGAPVCLCPVCLANGSINHLVGGARSAKLACSEGHFEIDVTKNTPKKVKA